MMDIISIVESIEELIDAKIVLALNKYPSRSDDLYADVQSKARLLKVNLEQLENL